MIASPVRNGAAAIEVQRLGKTYRDGLVFAKRFTALRDVSLTVPSGGIFGLLGPNGAGKTTLVKILLGIISKSTGEASLLGLPAGSLASRRLVGYLPEHLRMAGHLTPYTGLDYFGSLAGLSAGHIRQHRDRLLEQVGLRDRARDRIRKFSKGMLQRLGLAQALLSQPRLLFLDEPTDGLDPRARAEMREIIRNLQGQGVTIFLNSHLLQEVELICDEVAILDRGELKYCGPVSEAGNHAARASGLSGWLMEFRLRSERTLQLPVVEGLHFSPVESQPGEQVFQVQVQNQQQVDAAVDQFRGQGASVVELKRVEATLEDAFLAMVEKT